jgi:hypothetical protein
MNIIKPVYVYKWVDSKQPIKYVFDPYANNYNSSINIIKEPIYQDSSKEDAINKIAYYINAATAATAATAANAAGDNKTPYYTWVNKESFLFDIETIKWKGYNINPFKSTDRKSEDINEAIDINYNKSIELFETTDIINIVFKSDFSDDNKYYYDNIKFKSNNYKADSNRKINELYKLKIINNKKTSDEYYNVVFAAKITDIHPLITIFDKLTASHKIQLIQYITDQNKAYYKLYKKHTFKNRKELSRLFKLNKDSKECINIYYTKNIFITIFTNGIINLTFNYSIDKGSNINDINKYKDELNEYINKVLNIKVVFKEKLINARILYYVNKTKYDDLKKEIRGSTIFVSGKDEEFYYYKRTANYKDRSAIDRNIKNEIDNNDIKMKANDAVADITDTRIIVKKESGGYMIDVKNAKSFFEFECLEFWISKIIESSVKDTQSSDHDPEPEPNPINAKSPKVSTGIHKNESEINSSSGSDDIRIHMLDKYAKTSSESSGGNGDDNTKYLINKLKIADRDIWGVYNKSRKCQKDHQPLPLTAQEYNDLTKKGYKFDNFMVHNKNHYVCPRIWCPKSNVPLDESDPNAKCPAANEKPMLLNEDMKNKNKPRYVYLKKKDNIPCCGKKLTIYDDAAADAADDDAAVDAGIDDVSDDIKEDDAPVKPIVKPKPKPETKPIAAKLNKQDADKNHIMKKYPIEKKDRYGDIPKELYKILYPNNYEEFFEGCLSPNNINKRKCILRKGLINIEDISEKYGNRYDNIINTIAYLVGETKESFVENIKNKIDIIVYISLDNGNICRDFGDYEPVLYEYNRELYGDLKKHIHIINNKYNIQIDLPKFDSKNEKAVFKISRLLYIYKSYRKFIEYIAADNYPDDKGIQYLYSIIAFLYKKLLIVWENTINSNSNAPSVDLLVPDYINDIIEYYGLQKKTEIIMILKEKWNFNGNHEENKKHKDNKLYELMKDRDNIYFYEPLIIKTINLEKKHYALSEFPNIMEIINYQPINSILSNLKYINNFIKDESAKYSIETLIINDDYTVDKIMLKNNILIRFNPQGTILLPYLIKELNIKNVVFLDDIVDTEYKITITNHIYAQFLKKINQLKDFNITVDIGVNNDMNTEITKNILTIHKDHYDDDRVSRGSVILFGKKNEFEEYNDKNTKVINKWLELRSLVKDRLLSILETKNNKIVENSKKSRIEFIKYLVGLFDNGSHSSRSKEKIQIILEEIPVFTKDGLNNWYASTLLHTKYDYINGLSDNFVDNGTELLFTQFLIEKNIPKNILYYHEANPRIIHDIHDNTVVNYDNTYDDAKKHNNIDRANKENRAVADIVIKMPQMFEGEPKDLNSKWTKYKKKIWWQLKYIKNDYIPNNIIELFSYFKSLDNDIVNNYSDIIEKTFKHYHHEFNKGIKDGLVDNKKEIKKIFKDPHFYTSYINAMNQLNNTKKIFKTVELFLTTYFYKSETAERLAILNNLSTSEEYVYHPNESTFFNISKILNISILIIHNRAEYGKAANISKRADDKDLSITTSIFKADNNELDRPLLILYRKNDKIHLSYYVIRNMNTNNIIYAELKDAPEEIKTMIMNAKKTSTYSSSSSTQTSNI